jgi:phage tail protein X
VEAVFTRGALDRVIRRAGGNPARINILCSNALAAGYEKAQRPLSAGTVQEVIRSPRGAGRVNYLPWALSAAGVLLILVVWLALNPSPFFSPQRPSPPAVTGQGTSAPAAPAMVSEAQPVPSAPAVSPPEAKEAATETPQHLPRAEEEPPAVEKTPAGSGTGSKHRGEHPPALKKLPVRSTRVVKKGDNIYRLTWEVYGFSSPELVEYVRKHNPGLKDFKKLPLGEKVVFPKWPEGKPR